MAWGTVLRPRPADNRRTKQLLLAGSAACALATVAVVRPSALDLALFAGFYLASMIGVTVGYHRMLAHGAFEASGAVKHVLFALAGTAFQGAPSAFAAIHVHHHANADGPDDRHSPRYGWWYAHLRWFCDWAPDERSRARFRRDRIVRFHDRHDDWFGFAAYGLAALLGGLIGGSLHAAWTGSCGVVSCACAWRIMRCGCAAGLF